MDDKLHSGADFSDYDVAQIKPEDTGYPFLRGAQGLPAEASQYVDESVDTYEESNGVPYTAMKLGYNENFKIDSQVEMKVRAIDEYILLKMHEEGTSKSKVGYDTIFNRMTQMLGESPEEAKNHNSRTKILDNLFMQVSIANRVSSKTYLKNFAQKYQKQHIKNTLSKLKALI